MRIPSILSLPLLVWMWTAPGVAHSQQDHVPAVTPNPFAAQPLSGSRIPPMNFYGQDGNAHDLNLSTLKRLNPFVFHPNELHAQHQTTRHTAPGTEMALNNERCYATRDYQFSRTAPQSDTTKLSGFSTCLPATQAHAKAVR